MYNEDHIVFYGSKGAIYIKGHYGQGPLYIFTKEKTWKELETPQSILDNIPDIEGDTERNWECLAKEFVKDRLRFW